MQIKKVMVVGAGQMGAGIAQVCAQAGCRVILRDVEEAFVEKGISVIAKNLQRSVEKERMTENNKNVVLKRIKGTVDLKDGADSGHRY